jgi:hypothetical protein
MTGEKSGRIQSFSDFWPYYLGEHRVPLCRHMHFIGTAGWFILIAWGFYTVPVKMGIFLAIKMVGLFIAGALIEKKMNALWFVALIIFSGFYLVPQVVIPALLWAYGWAWVGHFKIEHNRPATFTYPAWSLLGDYRMWAQMARGKLWSGDPLPGSAPDGPEAQVNQPA